MILNIFHELFLKKFHSFRMSFISDIEILLILSGTNIAIVKYLGNFTFYSNTTVISYVHRKTFKSCGLLFCSRVWSKPLIRTENGIFKGTYTKVKELGGKPKIRNENWCYQYPQINFSFFQYYANSYLLWALLWCFHHHMISLIKKIFAIYRWWMLISYFVQTS